MSTSTPTFPGWYEDPETKGTSYWDGHRWTGDSRPPRKPFAAEALETKKGGWFLGIGIFFLIGTFATGTESELDLGTRVVSFLISIPLIVIGIYMLRGKGPTTKAVVQRVARENQETQARHEAAAYAASQAQIARQRAPQTFSPAPNTDAAQAAQVNAIANQDTAKALQNLQELLFTRTITDEEFQAAKNKLFASTTTDSYTEIQKLADLYNAGLIGDYEFIAAKARILGI